jgi:imidazolonepropionase-like amidohydrolase
LGKTAPVEKLIDKVKIVFGTDSTLTASWNGWEHFRKATGPGLISENQLLSMLTTTPSRLWNFNGPGIIAEGATADLVVITKTGNLFDHNPEDILLVMTNGITRLTDGRIREDAGIKNYNRVIINGVVKKVQGDLSALVNSIREYFPDAKFPFSNA